MPTEPVRNSNIPDMQARFVTESLTDLNRTAAYKTAGEKVRGRTPAQVRVSYSPLPC